ncbi:DMT family transporter [Cohnella sp. AR92]|uniref:DMT family transporter n=1 Tax=Cohnella sp. AR92 TaxID=648716 RepID=UPI000F8D4BDB|nr:DMT family transporter [Cohnella sp. AR92]RUS47313.1 DMT family transporter [Cohnella sp. AR92]
MIPVKRLQSNLLLLLAACIWGFAFVAQREGMSHMGPFTFNAIRFMLGAASLLPLIYFLNKKKTGKASRSEGKAELRRGTLGGVLAGLILFTGSSLQQIGLVYTTAGKAAFVTGLYIVIVPFLGLFLKQRLALNSVLGAIVAVVGLYLLCVTNDLSLNRGDLYALAGAFFWSLHILLIDKLSQTADGLKLSLFQTVVCAVLSWIAALATETITLDGVSNVWIPLLYGGVCSVGIAYTLQIIGQRDAHPTQAAIILSTESVFAALGGFLILDEQLGVRGVLGCVFMLAGMLLPQLPSIRGLRQRRYN